MMSQNNFFHGFGGPQHGKNDKNACFWAKNNIQNAVGGVCMHGKILFWKLDQFAIWRTHFPNLEFWEAPQDPATLFCRKTSLEKKDLCDQKVTIKGMKFHEASLGLLLRTVLLGNDNYVINILTVYQYTYVTNILTVT